MATSISYVTAEELEEGSMFLASLEIQIENFQKLEFDEISAIVDAESLRDDAKFYVDELYQPDNEVLDVRLFSESFFSADLTIDADLRAALPLTFRTKWSEIKARARKIACEVFKFLGANANLKDLLRKTLEKLKESLLGGLPQILTVIIVGILSFAAKKGFEWLCS
ncbi:hypothetical protein LZD49_33410 [Dyadobacter sp. CY261]|uniref:hypothetical protein n=1 Tax=Dyadobacter sp. CY261 TaxID=2907203 RepID=UPI001F280471|nr:hypothetical protein [Dyadobacter sp. CY261]MCF0075425.1 hypothetical protein [Dyadobacter sp. CY261]